MRNNEQGRSMIEMLGVLAIVGVLSVGGIAGYSKAMNKFKTNKVIDQVNMISTNIRTLFSSQRDYTGLNNKVAVNAGLVPGEMYDQKASTDVGSTSGITNAFGGDVQIHATENNAAYYIYFEGIPASSCAAFVTTDWGGEAGTGLLAVVAGTEAGTDDLKGIEELADNGVIDETTVTGVPGRENGIPFSVSMMGTACPKSGTVNIGWVYQ